LSDIKSLLFLLWDYLPTPQHIRSSTTTAQVLARKILYHLCRSPLVGCFWNPTTGSNIGQQERPRERPWVCLGPPV